MKAEFINPFVVSTCDVFKVMLECELTRGELSVKQDSCASHEVSGVIGMSGEAAGTVVVSLSREMALQVAGALLGEMPESVDADVVDAIGEIANMVAGGAKSRLDGLELSIGLPTVICGENHTVNFPSNATPIIIPFSSDWGPLSIEVGLIEKRAPVAV
jgi:chemotaxis protein CheX